MYDQRDCGGAARYVEPSTHWTRPSSDTSSLGRLFPDGSTWRACPMAVGRIAVAGARLGPESSPTPGMTSRTGHEEEGNLDTHAHNRLDMTSTRTRREREERQTGCHGRWIRARKRCGSGSWVGPRPYRASTAPLAGPAAGSSAPSMEGCVTLTCEAESPGPEFLPWGHGGLRGAPPPRLEGSDNRKIRNLCVNC